MQIPKDLLLKKILVVDDANSIRMLIRSILLDAGFKHIDQAKHGQEAINKLKRSHTDLIICDWNMPVMSGLELFKKINADPELKKTAFIMLTSSSETIKVKEAISRGITSYILKPFNAEILLKNTVQTLQENKPQKQTTNS